MRRDRARTVLRARRRNVSPCHGPCESALRDVYGGVLTNVASIDSAELAYERAYDRHWSDVFRFALAWTNDWTSAEDLAQDAFLRLWDHRAQLDWDRPVLPWLLVATRRLATDRFRRLRRRMLPGTRQVSLDAAVHDRWLDVCAAMSRPVAARADGDRHDRARGLDLRGGGGGPRDERRCAPGRRLARTDEAGGSLMDPTHRSDRILDEWDAVAARARPATRAPRRHGVRSRVSATVLAGTGVAVLAIVLAAGWLGRPASDGVGATPVPRGRPGRRRRRPGAASAAASPGSSRGGVRRRRAHGPHPRLGRRGGPADGDRRAHERVDRRRARCRASRRPQLVDGSGAVLIDGTPPVTARGRSSSGPAACCRPSCRPATTAARRPRRP